jgi:hypothetical protein
MKTETATRTAQTTNPDQPGDDQSRAGKRLEARTRRIAQLRIRTGLRAGEYCWG